jgi:threonine/homoserine/homoserine lactone efflux protein
MDLTTGLILGIVYVAAPGPIGVETLRQGMKGGFSASLAVQAGSSLGLIAYALLALSGVGPLLQGAAWQLAAGVCGTAVLIYLGGATIRDGRKLAARAGDDGLGGTSAWRAFKTGATLSLANPLEIIFWLSLGNHMRHVPGVDSHAFLAAFLTGCIGASLVIVLLATFWHTRLTVRAALVISWMCGLALIGFGFKLALSVGRQLVIQ